MARRRPPRLSAAPFDPEALLVALDKHQVRFVIIGGIAARLWGSPLLTGDLDICYDRQRGNLESLAAALRDLQATLRGAPADLPFRLSARTLAAGDHFTFSTRAGALDCLGTPSGSSGYDELSRTAQKMKLGRFEVFVASIDDLI